MLIKQVLPDGSVVTISRLWTEHRDASGAVLSAREPTPGELADLAAVTHPTVWDDAEADAAAVETALGVTRAQVRAAGARLVEIAAGAGALAQAAPLPTGTTAQVVTAVQTLDARQRQIGAALADIATILRALGRVVLRDAT